MMNKDNRNDKIRKIAKKGLTLSLCAVLAGGLAAGSFEGINKITGTTTVEAANKDEHLQNLRRKQTTVILQQMTAQKQKTAQQKVALIYLILHQKHFRLSYLSQQNLFRKYRTTMEYMECTDMLHSSRNRKWKVVVQVSLLVRMMMNF